MTINTIILSEAVSYVSVRQGTNAICTSRLIVKHYALQQRSVKGGWKNRLFLCRYCNSKFDLGSTLLPEVLLLLHFPLLLQDYQRQSNECI